MRSPQLLMVSGIGPKETLESLGIEVIADRAGVGQNMWVSDDTDYIRQLTAKHYANTRRTTSSWALHMLLMLQPTAGFQIQISWLKPLNNTMLIERAS